MAAPSHLVAWVAGFWGHPEEEEDKNTTPGRLTWNLTRHPWKRKSSSKPYDFHILCSSSRVYQSQLRSRNKPSYFSIVSWLFNTDPYNGSLQSPQNWVVFHPLCPKQPVFLSLLNRSSSVTMETFTCHR